VGRPDPGRQLAAGRAETRHRPPQPSGEGEIESKQLPTLADSCRDTYRPLPSSRRQCLARRLHALRPILPPAASARRIPAPKRPIRKLRRPEAAGPRRL